LRVFFYGLGVQGFDVNVPLHDGLRQAGLEDGDAVEPPIT
jgi:hypothetical protein